MKRVDKCCRLMEIIKDFKEEATLMEVCGTHAVELARSGIRQALPSNVELVSGPGCPVCVTSEGSIDHVCELASRKDIIIASYGDMIRVPGSNRKISLEKARAAGANVRMVHSSIDALNLAEGNPHKKVVFLGIGFETTAPNTAAAVMEARRKAVNNFYVYSMHKRMEPIMTSLLEDEDLKIDGFILPGHVACIIGEKGFEFLEENKSRGTITGFEGEELLLGIGRLLQMIALEETGVSNCYERLVTYEGNQRACQYVNEVFEPCDDFVRGMGKIPNCGLKLKKTYEEFDILNVFPGVMESKPDDACQCGEVIKGKMKPVQCRAYGKECTPEHPMGPCMVSSEGSCAACFATNK